MARATGTEIGVFPDKASADDAVRRLESSRVPAERIGLVDDPRRAREVVGTRTRSFLAPMTVAGALVGLALLLVIPGSDAYRTNPSALVPWLVVGALAGVLTGALVGAVLPRHDPSRYQRRVEGGAVLVTVHCAPRERARIRRILSGSGAANVAHEGTAETP